MAEQRWTAQQAAAIRATGPVILEANAGTGKTTTVVGALSWRLGFDVGRDEHGVAIGPCPAERRLTLDRLAAITFTEKAAFDLRQKLREAVERYAPKLLPQLDRASIGTIHSFCGEALREHALRFRLDPAFSVLDERDAMLEQEQIARDVVLEALTRADAGAIGLVERYPLDGRGDFGTTCLDLVLRAFRDLRWHADRWAPWLSSERLDVAAVRRAATAWTAEDAEPLEWCDALVALGSKVERRWATFLVEENARDFDALILDLRDRLADATMAPALASLRRRYGLLVIDEFQDTDEAQWDIARRIALPQSGEGPQLFLVGDPKQSIYRFRGADVSVWNAATAAIPTTGRLQLTRNFRSAVPVVDFVNRVCEPAITETGAGVSRVGLASRVAYVRLESARGDVEGSSVVWLESAGKAEERRKAEAEMAAATIRDIVFDRARGDKDGIRITDPDTLRARECAYRDIAILFRSRACLSHVTDALEHYGVPYYLAGDAGLKDRLEVLDVLTLLRLLENPRDDMRAFAFLRSSFVGLRDEVIARMRLERPQVSLLRAAHEYLARGHWFAAPEHPEIVQVERESLSNALAVLEDLDRMPERAPLHRLADEAIERLGYRLHLLLRPQSRSRLANLERFIGLLEGHRHHTAGTFLELWERMEQTDVGIPQAPLYSKDDDVVTLSTIHSAKGLEWPVVFLVDSHGRPTDRCTGSLANDRVIGPVLFPKKDERGDRTCLIADRMIAEERAEDARLLYVVTTRARDRLYVAAPTAKPEGEAKWLAAGRDASVKIVRKVPDVALPEPLPEPAFEWLDRISGNGASSPLVSSVEGGPNQYARSASELMARLRGGPDWRSRYAHGILPVYRFAPRPSTGGGAGEAVPAWLRGVVVHGVLEKIKDAREIEELLDVTVGALESPELEEAMAPGSAYRSALETELRRVVSSPEWVWYVEGAHWRELEFVHFRRSRRWRVGALDLYRHGTDRDVVIDFKTSDIGADAVVRTAGHYAIQVALYRAAVSAATGRPTEMRLHFTVPGVVWQAP